jgi:hypothetical protein
MASGFRSPANNVGISLSAEFGEDYNPSTDFSGEQVIAPTASAAAPEPSSFLLFGTGLVGFTGSLCRRFARQS